MLSTALAHAVLVHAQPQALQFAHVYSDSMVLQREPYPASVWGWGAPGAKVTVTIGGSGGEFGMAVCAR
jgi:hypothetical protein